MTRNVMTITKWLPVENQDLHTFFGDCKQLKLTTEKLTTSLSNFLNEFKTNNCSKVHHKSIDKDSLTACLEHISVDTDKLREGFNTAFQKLFKDHNTLPGFKMKCWKLSLWISKLKLSFYLQHLIYDVAHLYIYYGETFLVLTLRISNTYNQLLSMDNKYGLTNSLAVSSNTCPYLLYPLRKISITKLLQILAQNRAELCCHKLIDCLLDTYTSCDNHHQQEDDNSDNSDLEIYRALTQHLSPINCPEKRKSLDDSTSGSFSNLGELISYEEQNVLDLLTVALKIAPNMLGKDGIKRNKNGETQDEMKICTKAKKKVVDYYQEILWGEAGNFLEHIILWWGSSPLSSRPPHSSQHLREWISQFTPTADIPSFIISALTTLADALGVHVTSTSWDRNFRLALVASQHSSSTHQQPQHVTTTIPLHSNPKQQGLNVAESKSTNTGRLFGEMLVDLVALCNQCEVTNEWIVGAPLDELPLVEQIPVLHRLDHSIHTTRLWAINETKKLANNWNVESFFLITHSDIVNCLSTLNGLRVTDHSIDIEKGGLGVHVEVCSKMREKLVSEVKINAEKLIGTPQECVNCLASICTTLSLAHLKMIFPKPYYWRKHGENKNFTPSNYVDTYLDQILTPVLVTTGDPLICNMILKLMGEAWLDHIYQQRVRFSEHGARQLLCDFAYVAVWLRDTVHSSEGATATATGDGETARVLRDRMCKNEVLRRCEGVGRLLLRSPGEQIDMKSAAKSKSRARDEDGGTATGLEDNGDLEDDKSDLENTALMPAEMYVPNQEQWLELRANARKSLLLPICCSVDIVD